MAGILGLNINSECTKGVNNKTRAGSTKLLTSDSFSVVMIRVWMLEVVIEVLGLD